ncbi:MAG: phosphoribosylglycinamide formyltransferase [Proteobacteria bacterium]|nr:phosphoribosylglycinamide formyltransferase [Pseudomonadota bacterium]
MDIAVLVSGSGTNLQSIIDSVESGHLKVNIKLVLSDNAEAYALKRAKKHNIATAIITKADYPKRKEFDQKTVETLKEHSIELVVLAGFMRLLSPVMIDAFPERIINIHPSLLPAFPGLDVQKKALEHGVKFSGCTVHFVDEGLDSGAIIIQEVVPVLDGDTVETLKARILEKEHIIYPKAIEYISKGLIQINGRRVKIKELSE